MENFQSIALVFIDLYKYLAIDSVVSPNGDQLEGVKTLYFATTIHSSPMI